MKENNNKMFTEEQLEAVSGGGWMESDMTYKSGGTPRFKVGDVVGGRYKIISVSKKKSGFLNKEFIYSVVHFDDMTKIYKNIYESQLLGFAGMLD